MAAAQVEAEMAARLPRAIRAAAAASHGENGSGGEMGQPQPGGLGEDMMVQGWGNSTPRGEAEDDPSDDFLNDENEQENGDAAVHEWRTNAAELDLNSR
ncbi:hypothetical protein HPP92_027982 [Vanilla planifolia]|nr:hypothetical protein HPP92_027982 [Vanilla planifolia]